MVAAKLRCSSECFIKGVDQKWSHHLMENGSMILWWYYKSSITKLREDAGWKEGKSILFGKVKFLYFSTSPKMFAKLSKLILDCRIIADDAGFTHTRSSLENTFSFLFFLTETFLVFSLDADALSQIQNTKLKDNFFI